jgi:hypothetical protein
MHSQVNAQFGRRNTVAGDDLNMRNTSDTTNKKSVKSDDKISIYFFLPHDTLKKQLDTSLQLVHRNPLLNLWDIDLGNFASASKSLLFTPHESAMRQSGFQLSYPFLGSWPQTKFYATTRPFTDLYYRLGTKQEQMLEIMHTQNIKPNWNVMASYAKIGSPGMYSLQKTNHDKVEFNTNYQSQNQRYRLMASIQYRKIQQDENGGILFDSLLYDLRYNDKRLLPVRFDKIGENSSSVKNYYRHASINLEQSYFLGNYTNGMLPDSSIQNDFKPRFGLRHQLYTSSEHQRYKDLAADSLNYSKLEWRENLIEDSVVARAYITQFGNKFSLAGNLYWKKRILQADAGYGVEIDKVEFKSYVKNYLNNYLFASINKAAFSNSDFNYGSSFKFYFLGNALGNLEFDLYAGKSLSEKLGKLKFRFQQSIQQAPYIFSYYQSNKYSQENTFLKQTISHLQANYTNEKYKLNMSLHSFVIANYIFRDSNWRPSQYNKAIPISQFQLNKSFHWKNFVFDNQVLMQEVDESSPIHLPKMSLRVRWAYESLIFNNKLRIATGIDSRYNTGYLADNYLPAFNTFTPQYVARVSNVPQVSYFFNFGVRRYRAFISFDELQQILTANNMNFPHYAAQNFMARFGFHWVFIN